MDGDMVGSEVEDGGTWGISEALSIDGSFDSDHPSQLSAYCSNSQRRFW